MGVPGVCDLVSIHVAYKQLLLWYVITLLSWHCVAISSIMEARMRKSDGETLTIVTALLKKNGLKLSFVPENGIPDQAVVLAALLAVPVGSLQYLETVIALQTRRLFEPDAVESYVDCIDDLL